MLVQLFTRFRITMHGAFREHAKLLTISVVMGCTRL